MWKVKKSKVHGYGIIASQNISKNTTLIIPEHFVPTFKPSKSFVEGVKSKVKKNKSI